MDSGPFFFGEPPDDLSGLGFGGGDSEALPRGWLPPEDRLWRHPSELHPGTSRSPGEGGGAPGSRRGRGGNRWVGAAVGVMGAAAVASVAVAATRGPTAISGSVTRSITANDTSLTTAPASASSGAGPVTVGPGVVKMVDAMRASMVTLVAAAGSGTSTRATGVVLPGGSLVLTAAEPVGTATTFDVVGADGQHHAGQLVGTDRHSGVSVVQLQDRLAAASFADEPVQADQLAVAACMCGNAASGGRGTTGVAIGMVHAVGTTATLDGGPSLVDAIEAEMPLGPSSFGSVLLDDNGNVIGILDGERSTGDDVFGYFVPASLAVGVADELAKNHSVAKGWLGVVCADAPGGGAVVTAVLPDSPASDAGLQPGDVVEAVDTHGVGSLADLQGRLYTSPPGSRLVLTVLHHGAVDSTPVVVRASPS